jgi:hypothetical protein
MRQTCMPPPFYFATWARKRFTFSGQPPETNCGLTDSDIDIVVRGVPASCFFASASRAADALGRPVDLVDLDVPSPTVNYILEAGILVRVL